VNLDTSFTKRGLDLVIVGLDLIKVGLDLRHITGMPHGILLITRMPHNFILSFIILRREDGRKDRRKDEKKREGEEKK
jgi:hypothetical protein